MLSYDYVAVIDHDWSLYVIYGRVGDLNFERHYAIIHDEDIIDPEFLDTPERVLACVIPSSLGKRLEAYYE